MSNLFEELRAREFSRLDAGGHVYLDYTGSGLYSERQLRAHTDFLSRNVLGNPHSRNPTSLASTRILEDARERVRSFFDADAAEYEVVFTLNASGALKLVGESYPFGPESRLVLTADNHNSVLGVREYALARGATVDYVPLGADLRIADLEEHLAGADASAANLFVFPAQSNFSGVKHPLEYIRTAHQFSYEVMLDAAAFVPANPLSLRQFRPEFVCVSFYKMFGLPTGVGALLARRDALAKLKRPWFGGGTVRFVAAQNEVQLLHSTGRGFEDGTPNYLDIAAVPIGLDFLDDIGMDSVAVRVAELTRKLLSELAELRYRDGSAMVRIYGPCSAESRGGTVAFNLADSAGEMIDFREVEARASRAGISLRSGYFCNPGAAEFALEQGADEVRKCFKSLPEGEFSLEQFSVCMNPKPVGAVRASVGIATNQADIDRLIEVLLSFRNPPGLPLRE